MSALFGQTRKKSKGRHGWQRFQIFKKPRGGKHAVYKFHPSLGRRYEEQKRSEKEGGHHGIKSSIIASRGYYQD